MRLLFVEDDFFQVTAYQDRLEWYEAEGVFIDNVAAAIAALASRAFDYIILDHRIGGGTGEDVHKYILHNHIPTPVIAASSMMEGEYPGAVRLQKTEVFTFLESKLKRKE